MSCKGMKPTTWASFPLLAALLAAVPLDAQETRPRSIAEDLRMFSQVLNQIRTNHPDSLDSHLLLMAAIEGMVRAADPHSYVLPAVRLSPAREEAWRKGELHPVPIEFIYLADAPVVVSIQPGTRAAELDILAGDELIAIDGGPVTAESPEELEIVLAGREGSRVSLSFLRRRFDGTSTIVRREVRRERVADLSAVGAVLMLEEGTGYLRITHFASERVADETAAALDALRAAGMERLVLDLRDNGGGYLDQAAAVAALFLAPGAIAYTSEGRKQEVYDTVRVAAVPGRPRLDLPVVLLVNGGTASAGELLVGALQDHDRALIVGYPTFGKSLLMRAFPMTDGSMIMLTVGHFKTPCGRVVQRDYRALRTRDYFRLAGTATDTTGRASCRTAGGRTLYGGGGIYPDVVLPAPGPPPRWLSALQESEVLLRWVGTFLAAAPLGAATVETFVASPLPAEIVDNFVQFAASDGIAVPESQLNAALLNEILIRAIAWGRWGPDGYYTVAALRDVDVLEAVEQLPEAERLPGGM